MGHHPSVGAEQVASSGGGVSTAGLLFILVVIVVVVYIVYKLFKKR